MLHLEEARRLHDEMAQKLKADAAALARVAAN